MKKIALYFLLLLAYPSLAQNDFLLRINDTTIEIGMDQVYELMIDGKPVELELQTKDTLLFSDPLYTFNYPKGFSVSRLEVEQGIEQIMLMTAEGSGVLIQKYASMDPSGMKEMMLSEITKESLNYGYEMKRKDYDLKLVNDDKLRVIKAVLTYRGEKMTYEVAALGGKDQGVLIITMITNEEFSENGKALIEMMWATLNPLF